jgi:hypothetical protein
MNDAVITRIVKQLFKKGTPVYMTQGKKKYYLSKIEDFPEGDGIVFGTFTTLYFTTDFGTTNRRMFGWADSAWKLEKRDDGWEMSHREDDEVNEARRPKSVEIEEMPLAGHMALRTISKWLENDKKVYMRVSIPLMLTTGGANSARGYLRKIEDAGDGTIFVEMENGSGWTSVANLSYRVMGLLKLEKETSKNGAQQLEVSFDESKYDDTVLESEKPLIHTMIQKLFDKGKRIKFEDEHGRIHTVSSFHYSRPGEVPSLTIALSHLGNPQFSTYRWEGDKLDTLSLKKDEDTWILYVKQKVDENFDRPLVVSMLARVLRSHFKDGKPPVFLHDEVFDEKPMPVHGYQVKNGDLHLSVKQDEVGLRDIIYPASYIDGSDTLNLKLRKKPEGWVLQVENI